MKQKDLEDGLKNLQLLDQYLELKKLKQTDKNTYNLANTIINKLMDSLYQTSYDFLEQYEVSKNLAGMVDYYEKQELYCCEPSEYLM